MSTKLWPVYVYVTVPTFTSNFGGGWAGLLKELSTFKFSPFQRLTFLIRSCDFFSLLQATDAVTEEDVRSDHRQNGALWGPSQAVCLIHVHSTGP